MNEVEDEQNINEICRSGSRNVEVALAELE